MTLPKAKTPCIDCREKLAYRAGGRCHECHVVNQRERLVAFTSRIKSDPTLRAAMKARKSAKEAAKRAAVAKRKLPALMPHKDTSIALYRAEKLAKTERGPATRGEQLLREIALQIRTEQPKAGRPRKAA
jgi:hypothetical protein